MSLSFGQEIRSGECCDLMELSCCPAGRQHPSNRNNTQETRTKIMANTLLPLEERNLTPDKVESLHKRRRRSQLFLVMSFQCLIVSALLTFGGVPGLTRSP